MASTPRWATWPVAAIAGLLSACSSPASPADADSPSCPADRLVYGVCAGVPDQPVCGQDVCTEGAACGAVVSAGDPESLASAVSSAVAGTCIALAPGDYPSVSLPGGVSLLGKAAAEVSLDGVTLGSKGGPALLRGLTVGGGGVVLEVGAAATIESVHVVGAAGPGIHVEPGASANVVTSTIAGSLAGVYAAEAEVSIQTSLLKGNLGPGVWVECPDGCACATGAELVMDHVAIRDNAYVGAALRGAKGTLSSVEITSVVQLGGEQGGGLSLLECAGLSAKAMRVADNGSYGIRVDGSAAALGGPSPADAVEVSGNLYTGIWVRGTSADQPVVLQNVRAIGNSVAGFALDGDAQGFIIQVCEARETKARVVPVESMGQPAGSESVGDGLFWEGGAQATIDGLSLEGNERAGVLVSGEVAAGSSVAGITLGAGDEVGFIIQVLPPNGVVPAGLASAGVDVTTTEEELYKTAFPPPAPGVLP